MALGFEMVSRTLSVLLLLIPACAFAQTKFEVSDVHPAAKSSVPFARFTPPRNGRYEVTNASIVDLVRSAWAVTPDKVLGGPSWVEWDRFDVIAKEPVGTTAAARGPMLQALLEDRFGLVAHRENRPVAGFAVTAGKSPHMKQADGTEESGCRNPPPSGGRGNVITMFGGRGGAQTLELGPGGTITFQCRNITMADFVNGLPRMFGASFGTKRVVDETGLKGSWNFDVKWSIGFGPMNDPEERVSMADALEKQLGLKLEDRQLPADVVVIEKANRTPTPNAPDIAKLLPPVPAATEFEVADVKVSAPGGRGGRFQNTNGRFVAENAFLAMLLNQSFGGPFTGVRPEIVGLPDEASSLRFDVIAKAPDGAPAGMDSLQPMLLNLLTERFKLKYHREDRPLQAYSLVAAKPKMKKADPASRTHCNQDGNSPTSAGNVRTLVCQNVTMAQFADQLQGFAFELRWPVLDETGLDGTWDFTLSYSPNFGPGRGRGADGGSNGPLPVAADPAGGVTIFDAVQKQLGLKLESRKRPEPVIVIDHIETQPTDN